MKCTSKKLSAIICLFIVPVLCLSGCGNHDYALSYERDRNNSSYSVFTSGRAEVLDAFASDLCVTDSDVTDKITVDLSDVTAAGLFNLDDNGVIYAKNIHEKLNPASITKIMTALVALKYGNLEDTLTASANVKITESGAVLLGLNEGDTMTLNQALHALLLKSANDVAIMIAENIAGDVDSFCELMNQEARTLGATNCHFVNPNGLTDPEHYVTAYDLYLVFNEAVSYDKFVEIIQTPSYQSVYYAADGTQKTMDLSTSNLYLKNDVKTPNAVTVIGGKTGTTAAAGSCLILYSKDQSGKAYISIILQAPSRDILYQDMTELLDEIS